MTEDVTPRGCTDADEIAGGTAYADETVDFLANGKALEGLLELVKQAGAEAVGAGIAIEKGFQDGGANLRKNGLRIESLAIIKKMDENGIVFQE